MSCTTFAALSFTGIFDALTPATVTTDAGSADGAN